jgi:hypothetical protein
MFNLVEVPIIKDLRLTKPLTYWSHVLDEVSMEWFDKDGFELTSLEQFIYVMNDIKLNGHLRNLCAQHTWFTLPENNGFDLDHSMILYRFKLDNELLNQVKYKSAEKPLLKKLLHIKPKYGLDFDLNWLGDDEPLEVFHFEYDTNSFDEFLKTKQELEHIIMNTDWFAFKDMLLRNQDLWKPLKGFAQNNWKARQLGFDKAETLEKVWQ